MLLFVHPSIVCTPAPAPHPLAAVIDAAAQAAASWATATKAAPHARTEVDGLGHYIDSRLGGEYFRVF